MRPANPMTRAESGPRRSVHHPIAVLAPAILALGACAMLGPETTLRQQMRALHGCPEDQVKITSLGGSRYQVEGCGSTETFVCGQTDGWVCNR